MDHVTDVRSAESRCAAEDQGCWEIKGLCLFRIWVKRFLISTAALFFFCTNWSGLLTLWPDTRVTRTLKYDRLVSTFRHVEFKCWTNRRHRTSESFWPRPHLCLCLCLCMYQSQLVFTARHHQHNDMFTIRVNGTAVEVLEGHQGALIHTSSSDFCCLSGFSCSFTSCVDVYYLWAEVFLSGFYLTLETLF